MGSTRVESLDVARVRGLYLTVGGGVATLDGPLGMLQPESVTRAIVATLRAAPAQPGSASMRSRRTSAAIVQARCAFADLVGSTTESVLLGSTVFALQLHLAELLRPTFRLGDQIVLSRLDSDAIVTPWVRAARDAGVGVRWAEVDLETAELPVWQYEQLITPHTRLVTVPIGNVATGTLPDVAAIAEMAHAAGALVLVDACASAAHVPLDIAELGADLLTLSATSFGGPTVAAVISANGLLATLQATSPLSLESDALPVELIDGATASIDHLAGLSEFAAGSRRERLAVSIAAAGEHTAALWDHFAAGVSDLRHVTVLGGLGRRLPVFALAVADHEPGEVGEFLGRRGVSVWTGPSGMSQLLAAFGADEYGGAVFGGFMPHTTRIEVDRLLMGLAALT